MQITETQIAQVNKQIESHSKNANIGKIREK